MNITTWGKNADSDGSDYVASVSEALDNVIAEIDTLMYHARQKIDVIYSWLQTKTRHK